MEDFCVECLWVMFMWWYLWRCLCGWCLCVWGGYLWVVFVAVFVGDVGVGGLQVWVGCSFFYLYFRRRF